MGLKSAGTRTLDRSRKPASASTNKRADPPSAERKNALSTGALRTETPKTGWVGAASKPRRAAHVSSLIDIGTLPISERTIKITYPSPYYPAPRGGDAPVVDTQTFVLHGDGRWTTDGQIHEPISYGTDAGPHVAAEATLGNYAAAAERILQVKAFAQKTGKTSWSDLPAELRTMRVVEVEPKSERLGLRSGAWTRENVVNQVRDVTLERAVSRGDLAREPFQTASAIAYLSDGIEKALAPGGRQRSRYPTVADTGAAYTSKVVPESGSIEFGIDRRLRWAQIAAGMPDGRTDTSTWTTKEPPNFGHREARLAMAHVLGDNKVVFRLGSASGQDVYSKPFPMETPELKKNIAALKTFLMARKPTVDPVTREETQTFPPSVTLFSVNDRPQSRANPTLPAFPKGTAVVFEPVFHADIPGARSVLELRATVDGKTYTASYYDWEHQFAVAPELAASYSTIPLKPGTHVPPTADELAAHQRMIDDFNQLGDLYTGVSF